MDPGAESARNSASVIDPLGEITERSEEHERSRGVGTNAQTERSARGSLPRPPAELIPSRGSLLIGGSRSAPEIDSGQRLFELAASWFQEGVMIFARLRLFQSILDYDPFEPKNYRVEIYDR